jgi:hypothetical protein
MSTIKTTTLSTQGGSTVPVDTVVNGTAKAWVNFNGTGTVAIRRAFNVSSITDNGTGDYTINFTTAMADANYSAVCGGAYNRFQNTQDQNGTYTRTSSACRVGFNDSSGYTDPTYMEIVIFS